MRRAARAVQCGEAEIVACIGGDGAAHRLTWSFGSAKSAPEGIDAVRDAGGVNRVVTASIDSHLNDIGFIVPGLGDAGDRQYGVD